MQADQRQPIKSPNTAAITALALAAHRGLSQGDDSHFNRLIERLNASHRTQFINKVIAQYPSLAYYRDDLESEFMLAVYNEAKRYRDADKAFLALVRRTFTSRAIDILRSNTHEINDQESLDAKVESAGDAALPHEASEESLFILRETLNEQYDRMAALDPKMDAEKRALHRTQVELGLSSREVVNLAPGIYRNHQQYLRDVDRNKPLAARFGRQAR